MSESKKTTRQHNFKTFNMTRNHQKIRLYLIAHIQNRKIRPYLYIYLLIQINKSQVSQFIFSHYQMFENIGNISLFQTLKTPPS